ncbi:MAG: hypothetical protein WC617_13595 [Rhodanobacter sp.]
MKETLPPDPKVTRLPIAPAPPTPPREQDVSTNSVREEIQWLLGEAEPIPESESITEREPPRTSLPTMLPDPGPPPHHRHAIVCPQCDRWTWCATQHCHLCRFDLFSYYAVQERDQKLQRQVQLRKQVSRKVVGLACVGMALLFLGPKAPRPLSGVLVLVGIVALIGATVLLNVMERISRG